MKIKCDMCNEEAASVFCTADEASLCDGCDYRVHHANKLASKHPRISLLHPSPNSSPLCDICQEKRAVLFCQQDRAILCRDCDVPIHTANEHTQKHDRFLLTGVTVDHHQQPLTTKKPALHSFSVSNTSNTNNNNNNINDPPPINKSFPSSKLGGDNNSLVSGGINIISDNYSNNRSSSSTISEYLMETLPGWHVEDLLDDNLSTHLGFPKGDDGGWWLSSGETDHINSYLTSTWFPPSEKLGIWVPQAPPSTHFVLPQIGCQNGFKQTSTTTNVKATRKWMADDLFAVPQIIPPSSGSKRSRPFW